MTLLRRYTATAIGAGEELRSPLTAVKAGLVLLAAGCLAVGCSGPGGSAPTDVGSMAYPAPLPQGNVATTAVR